MQEPVFLGVTHIFTPSNLSHSLQIKNPVQIINNHPAFLRSSGFLIKGIFINMFSSNISTSLISVIKTQAYFSISHPTMDQEFRRVIG